MTHAQGDRWDVYREQIRLDAAGKPEALFQGEWEPLLMREEHFQIREDDGSISEHSEVFWASPRHGVVLVGDPLTDSEVCCARWGLEAAAHDIDAILALHRAQDVTTTNGFSSLADMPPTSRVPCWCFATGCGGARGDPAV